MGSIGDALGWPTEFLRPNEQKHNFSIPVKEFISWNKRVGGRWWGYSDEIQRGQYSDDTQLSLAVARSINDRGQFEPDQFAFFELPLWLHYERGGGRSVKAAARSLVRGKTDWLHNFYKHEELDYRTAGANGAAMRNLPIALAAVFDENRLIRDSALNAITTHGHPRALIGAILYGLSIRYALSIETGKQVKMLGYLDAALANVWNVLTKDIRIEQWVQDWEVNGHAKPGTFHSLFDETVYEARQFLKRIPDHINKPAAEYYTLIGAFDTATKGSGVGTVCAGIYNFLRENDNPMGALVTAVNMLGSDTDTISFFAGSLLGAQYGRKIVKSSLGNAIQDGKYISKTARQLHAIATDTDGQIAIRTIPIKRKQALLDILAWEIGLHEMFWDAIDVGGVVVHPALGRGTITRKEKRSIAREGYAAKLLRVQFQSGQSCVFHSRVKDETHVSESLTYEIDRTLREMA